jgi:hypothetical protein
VLVSSVRTMEESTKSIGLADTLAATGFTDRSGSKWSLSQYAEMAIRTVAHEALTEGTLAAMKAHGYELVKVSAEKTFSAACAPFNGGVFSLNEDNPDFPHLGTLPPFHPQCNHFLYYYGGTS